MDVQGQVGVKMDDEISRRLRGGQIGRCNHYNDNDNDNNEMKAKMKMKIKMIATTLGNA
jgi:hypothetical protein